MCKFSNLYHKTQRNFISRIILYFIHKYMKTQKLPNCYPHSAAEKCPFWMFRYSFCDWECQTRNGCRIMRNGHFSAADWRSQYGHFYLFQKKVFQTFWNAKKTKIFLQILKKYYRFKKYFDRFFFFLTDFQQKLSRIVCFCEGF